MVDILPSTTPDDVPTFLDGRPIALAELELRSAPSWWDRLWAWALWSVVHGLNPDRVEA